MSIIRTIRKMKIRPAILRILRILRQGFEQRRRAGSRSRGRGVRESTVPGQEVMALFHCERKAEEDKRDGFPPGFRYAKGRSSWERPRSGTRSKGDRHLEN